MLDRDCARQLCDRICEELFRSIEVTDCLSRREKRILAFLWSNCSTRFMTCRNYPGHEEVGRLMGLRSYAIDAGLRRLERKGFLQIIKLHDTNQHEYRLNALLLESAYDSVKAQQQ